MRLESYVPGAVDRALEEVLAPLGGIEAHVPTGSGVVLKPNFLRPTPVRNAVCTHPEVIRAMARLIASRGAPPVVVTDSPAFGTARGCAKRLGLADNAQLTVVDADDGSDSARHRDEFHRLTLSRRIARADVLINLPKLKTHGQMVLTAAVKNTFGAVVGMEKAQWHLRAGRDPRAFARLLLQIHDLVSPALSVLDGVVGMEGNGPGAGDPRPLGLLAASTDAHALDAVLCRVLDIPAAAVFTQAAAAEAGLLPDRDAIEVFGPEPEDLRPRPRWKLARPVPTGVVAGMPRVTALLDRLMSVRPHVDMKRCTACETCVDACAAEAIRIAGSERGRGRPAAVIDRDRCISCFCCQEVCPEGAISIRSGLAAGLFGLVRE